MGIPLDHPSIRQALEKGLIRAEDLEQPTCAGPAVQIIPNSIPAEPSAKKLPLVALAFAPPGTWLIPVYVVAGDNQRGKAKIGRAGHERRAVLHALARYHRECAPFAEAAQAGKPVLCRLVRIGGRVMDSDNVTASLKYVRDSVALFLGVGDGPRDPVLWDYGAESGDRVGVRVELSLLKPPVG